MNILVTGCSRGVGIEICKVLLEQGNSVYGVARSYTEDFKVLKKDPTNKHTLQLLMYYIMGMHSVNRNFENILYLGIFNPRLNKVYRCEIEKIDKSVISQIEKEVICYD